MRDCRSLLVLTVLVASSGPAGAECKLGMLVELPVMMDQQVPIVTANINGTDEPFVADSGSFWSLISESAAANLKLRESPAPWGLRMQGMGGEFGVRIATIDRFTLAKIPFQKLEFLVGGTEHGTRAIGLLGQNVFRIGDVEYDLANGVIRLMRAHECKNANFAYWAKPGEYSVITIEASNAGAPHTIGQVTVSGTKLRAMFDTGASRSVLSRRAAERAGIKLTGEGVTDGGAWTGLGRKTVQNWIVPVASFAIGDEEIRNTHLRVTDTEIPGADMLIGADFFLSHRIYVATSQRKLFFTYNGGAVFNLEAAAKQSKVAQAGDAPPPAAAPADGSTDGPAGGAAGGLGNEAPVDAAGFARRGAAFASRKEYDRAIADLTQACTMAPGEASYFVARGEARWAARQFLPASADFDEALRLKPDDPAIMITRARLRISLGDRPGAQADLEAAGRLVPNNSQFRLSLARAYMQLDDYIGAIPQFDWWIASHADDANMASALNSRCWARAVLGRELDKALADCDGAIKRAPATAAFHDSRGLVRVWDPLESTCRHASLSIL